MALLPASLCALPFAGEDHDLRLSDIMTETGLLKLSL